jgi:hypothetical protein
MVEKDRYRKALAVMNPNPKEWSKVGVLVWGHTGEVRMDERLYTGGAMGSLS